MAAKYDTRDVCTLREVPTGAKLRFFPQDWSCEGVINLLPRALPSIFVSLGGGRAQTRDGKLTVKRPDAPVLKLHEDDTR